MRSDYDALNVEVQRIHPDLIAELGPSPSGEVLLVISAGGIQSAFPAVKATVAESPNTAGWTVVAFRQPDEAAGRKLILGGVDLDCGDVRVRWQPNPQGVDLDMWLPVPAGTRPTTAQQLEYLSLDHSIGEYAAETRVGGIDLRSDPVPADAHTLDELRAVLAKTPPPPP